MQQVINAGMSILCRRPNVVGGLTAAGIVLFSGSCYAAALTEDKTKGMLAPYG